MTSSTAIMSIQARWMILPSRNSKSESDLLRWSRDEPPKAKCISSTTKKEPPPGFTPIPSTLPILFRNNLIHNLGHYLMNGKCGSPLNLEYTLRTTTQRLLPGPTLEYPPRWIRTFCLSLILPKSRTQAIHLIKTLLLSQLL